MLIARWIATYRRERENRMGVRENKRESIRAKPNEKYFETIK